MVQVEMHARWRNDRVLKWCSQQGIHVTAYAPMSSPQMADSMDKGHLQLLEARLFSTPVQTAICQLCFHCLLVKPSVAIAT